MALSLAPSAPMSLARLDSMPMRSSNATAFERRSSVKGGRLTTRFSRQDSIRSACSTFRSQPVECHMNKMVGQMEPLYAVVQKRNKPVTCSPVPEPQTYCVDPRGTQYPQWGQPRPVPRSSNREQSSYYNGDKSGERAHRAAVVIQRAFRSYQLQKQFSRLMSLALHSDRMNNRYSSLLGLEHAHAGSWANQDTPPVQLNSPVNEIDKLILEAAGIPIETETPQPFRRSLSMKMSHPSRWRDMSATRRRNASACRAQAQDDPQLPTEGVPSCPPLRGLDFYPQGSSNTPNREAEGDSTLYGYTRYASPARPRPPQRTVSFLAHETLPRKVSFLQARSAEVSQQKQQPQVHSDSSLYTPGDLGPNPIQERFAHFQAAPASPSDKAHWHNRSYSSPVSMPVTGNHQGRRPVFLPVQVETTPRLTDSPLPPPPYISPPTDRIPQDLPLPPPPRVVDPLPPPPPSWTTSLGGDVEQRVIPCDSASSSSSIDSGYGRSSLVDPLKLEHHHQRIQQSQPDGYAFGPNGLSTQPSGGEVFQRQLVLHGNGFQQDSFTSPIGLPSSSSLRVQNLWNHAKQALSPNSMLFSTPDEKRGLSSGHKYTEEPPKNFYDERIANAKAKKTVRIQTPDPTHTTPVSSDPMDPVTSTFLDGTPPAPERDTPDMDDIYRRRQYRVGLSLFNENPEQGISYLLHKRFLDYSPAATAKFLFGRKGLSKKVVGDYLSNLQRPFNLAVLHCFIHEMDFSGLHLDIALRQLQQEVTLPGEAQKIEKMVEVFSRRYIQCNQMFVAGFRSADTIFVLSYAIVLLNTDLHTRAMRSGRRMRREDFLRNLQGVDGGADLDQEMLQGIYDRIRNGEFRPGSDHVTQVVKVEEGITGKGRNELALAEPHRRLVSFCRLSEVPDVHRKEKKSGAHQRGVFLFNDILVNTKTVVSKKKTLHNYRGTVMLNEVRAHTFGTAQFPCGIQIQDRLTGKVVITFNARSANDQDRFMSDLQESISETVEFEQAKAMGVPHPPEESFC